ncbi:MAG: DUF6155 family protein [Robiginitalea sp.]
MSKKALKKYLKELDAAALREQILDLYGRFPEVKTYYDFVFNPREEKLLEEAMQRISEEYFPRRRKKAKARRSVAHRYIRHFRTLGVDPVVLSELMIFNLETAQRYESCRNCPEAFYRSIYKSFQEWGNHLVHHGIYPEFRDRATSFVKGVEAADWPNKQACADYLEQLTI